MEEAAFPPDMPPEWQKAIRCAAAAARVVVLGATDMGKSTFIRQVAAAAGQEIRVIDLDPGQKMIGPPGTLTLGRLEPVRLERFVFLGSTSSSSIGRITRAGAELAAASDRFIANTSGFVRGRGARLQAATVATLEPDLIIEIAGDLQTNPVIGQMPAGVPLIRLLRSAAAARKSGSARKRLRQQAFDAALEHAATFSLSRATLRFEPGWPVQLVGRERPVCALADAGGTDISYGILLSAEESRLTLHALAPGGPVRRLRLGEMWAQPGADGRWQLQEKLSPAWIAEPA